jgi:hypothetical protein
MYFDSLKICTLLWLKDNIWSSNMFLLMSSSCSNNTLLLHFLSNSLLPWIPIFLNNLETIPLVCFSKSLNKYRGRILELILPCLTSTRFYIP